MSRPNIFDKFLLKLNPRYLHADQIAHLVAEVNVGVIHKLPSIKPAWKIMDTICLLKGSQLKFLGLAKRLKLSEDIDPMTSIFEVVKPIPKQVIKLQVSPGDLVCVTPLDRQFIYPGTGNTSDDFDNQQLRQKLEE